MSLLRPANRAFIASTLAVGLILELIPWGVSWAPGFLALLLAFWNLNQPRKTGIGIGFLLGLLVDVHGGALLGEQALIYTIISYGAVLMHRRIFWFGTAGKIIHILALLLIAQSAAVLVRLILGSGLPGWGPIASCLLTALLWPIAQQLLLAPQRRPIDRDDNRPL